MHICLNPEYWADTLEVAKFVLLCMSIGMFIVYMLLHQHANETKQPAPIYVWTIFGVAHLLIVLGFIFVPRASTVVAMCH